MLIIERCRNLHSDIAYVTLAWLVDGRWLTRVVPRAVIADRKALVELAAFGLPVNTNNAPALVAFFEAFEAENAAVLPATIVTEQQGWLRIGGQEVFLCGESVIRNEPDSDQDEDDEATRALSVRFMPSDKGNEQIAHAIRRKGTFSGWRSAMNSLQHFPTVRLALFASFAAPLLKVLGVPSFIVDYAGETSTGKTTCLRIAASVWGNPWESGPDVPSYLFSWDATSVFLERLPEMLQNMPAIVDETKRAFKPEFLAKAIYSFWPAAAADAARLTESALPERGRPS